MLGADERVHSNAIGSPVKWPATAAVEQVPIRIVERQIEIRRGEFDECLKVKRGCLDKRGRKYPNPAIAWCGAFSLNRNGVPTSKRNALAEGRQKLASFGPGVRDICSNQPGSVTAKNPCMNVNSSRFGHRASTSAAAAATSQSTTASQARLGCRSAGPTHMPPVKLAAQVASSRYGRGAAPEAT